MKPISTIKLNAFTAIRWNLNRIVYINTDTHKYAALYSRVWCTNVEQTHTHTWMIFRTNNSLVKSLGKTNTYFSMTLNELETKRSERDGKKWKLSLNCIIILMHSIYACPKHTDPKIKKITKKLFETKLRLE